MGFASNFLIPSLVTLTIHAIIFAALYVSWEAQPAPKRIQPPKFIEAKLVQLETKTQKKASAPKKPKKIDLTAERREKERVRKAQEAKRQAEAKRKREAEQKAREKREREEAKRREQEQAAQKQREFEQRLQQEFEEALREEQGMLAEELYATEAQSYASKLRQRVQDSWARPPSARTGMTCELRIQLVPTGRVLNVTVIESSGNAAFDRSAVQAVKKVEVFPEVKEMSPEVFERYFRQFRMLFDPQDLRL